jgi:isopentenyl-diphosphate delta-isomerase
MKKYDASQTKFLDEGLILVDKDDKPVNQISKVEAHLNSYNNTGLAHRAFSVFLFNRHNELLIHQRSKKKITFPLNWTNSCCSHPLYTPDEMVEKNYQGAKKALRRRVKFELGCDLGEIEDIHFMGKIYYNAQCDETWGENEIDYCFFIKRDFKDSDFNINKDEIEDFKWIKKQDILPFLAKQQATKGEVVTPWFGAIMHYQMFEWWECLSSGKINNFVPESGIVNLNPYKKPLFKEAGSFNLDMARVNASTSL